MLTRSSAPPRACKLDIKDSFYRMFLRASDCPQKALILSKYAGEPQLITLPMACTMGWVQLPPTFCTMSETVCDEANARIAAGSNRCEPHRLEEVASGRLRPSPSCLGTSRPRGGTTDLGDLALQDTAMGCPLPTPEPDDTAPPSNRPLQKPLSAH